MSVYSRLCQRDMMENLPNSLLREITPDARKVLTLKKSRLQELSAATSSISSKCPNNFSLDHPLAKTPPISNVVAATLIFPGEDAGTAVCISSTGLILTCSHCVADSKAKFKSSIRQERWLLFASGRVMRARFVAWDGRRDLGLLQITATQDASDQHSSSDATSANLANFPFINVAKEQPKVARLICVGQPGSEDLEASTAGIATGYDVIHVSTGKFHGIAESQDPEDNSEIGALMHDCWTYWGHSGAPLVDRKTVELIGLHSSWDDETGMRRGVPLVAIRSFLKEHAPEVLECDSKHTSDSV